MIEAMGEGVDTELEGFEAGREVFDAVELVSPRALGAFDVAVELGPRRLAGKTREQQARNQRADDADDEVADEAEAGPLHDLPGEPPGESGRPAG